MATPGPTVMELTTWESVKLRLSHLSSPMLLLPMLLLPMPTTPTTMPMPQLPAATSRSPPQLLPMAFTSSTSVRLSPKELLFTLDLPPHPPSEAPREPLLPPTDTRLSMDTHLSMDTDTPPMVTSWESVRLRLSPKVLLFTLDLLPPLSTEAPRELQPSTLMLLTTESMATDTTK